MSKLGHLGPLVFTNLFFLFFFVCFCFLVVITFIMIKILYEIYFVKTQTHTSSKYTVKPWFITAMCSVRLWHYRGCGWVGISRDKWRGDNPYKELDFGTSIFLDEKKFKSIIMRFWSIFVTEFLPKSKLFRTFVLQS